MTVELTINARMWVGGKLILAYPVEDDPVEDDPLAIYRFAAETWTLLDPRLEWEIELAPPAGNSVDPVEPMSWAKGDAPLVGKLGHIPDVIHHYVEMRQRILYGERLENE